MQNALIKFLFVFLVTVPLTTNAKQHTTKQNIHHVYTKKNAKISVKPKVVKAVNSGLEGIASWYGPKFHGHKTASGEIYNQNHLTAAHRSIPLQSLVKVTNVSNHKSVVVRINDRGPHIRGRIIDLSKGAAKAINIDGIGQVSLTVVKQNKG